MPSDHKARSGFVSIKSKYKADLGDFHSFQVKVRNNRAESVRITINMACESFIENEVVISIIYLIKLRFLF